MVGVGSLGPSAAVLPFPQASPWPPWFFTARPSPGLVSMTLWLAILLGAAGLVGGLLAVRGRYQLQAHRLILGSVIAVVALTVVPPLGSADALLYVVYGRIAATGHSPYVMTPEQLKSSGDPVGVAAVYSYRNDPSRYGPIATATEEVASQLAGKSTARALFWMKVWNALAFLAIVLALDRLTCSQPTRRMRAHLLWSVNPLMLWAALAGGHNDVLAAAAGSAALFAIRGSDSARAMLAGLMLGVAAAIKIPFALLGAGLAWSVHRSVAGLTALSLGVGIVLVPSYLLAGRAAISAPMGVATMAPVGYTPWFAAARVLGLTHTAGAINALGLIGSVLLAAILLWRIPSGPAELPAVRVALAVALAWLIVSPQQRPWYDTMILPLMAVMPATRLDWIVIVRSTAAAVAGLPRLPYAELHPPWLSAIGELSSAAVAPIILTAVGVVLLWLCFTGNWKPEVGVDGAVAPLSAGPSGRWRRGRSHQAPDSTEDPVDVI